MVGTGVRRSRVGVYGGTFDPVHNGHVVAARAALEQLGLERVLLVPAATPWQKHGTRPISPPSARVAMVAAAIAGIPGLELSGVDVERGGETYTVDTLGDLARLYPGARFVLVVGADLACQLDTWKSAAALRDLADLAVVDRPGSAADLGRLRAAGWRVERVEAATPDVSSSEVRSRVARGEPVDHLVPPAVIRVIREAGLYAPS